MPPPPVKVIVMGVPETPEVGPAGLGTVSGAGLIRMLKLPERVPPAPSFTRTEKLKIPGVLGVPITEPPEARVRPSGSDPPLRVKVKSLVPPLAAIRPA